MAKFLQETVKESGLKADSVVRSDEFKEFFRKVSSHPFVVRGVSRLFRCAPREKHPVRQT